MLKTSNIAIIILFFAACNTANTATDASLETNILTHHIYFDLIDDISETELKHFKEVIQQLKSIPEVKEFEFGVFEDVGDKRALSQYEYFISLSFENKKSYDIYQESSIHINVKNKLRTYLSGPPATYDFHTIKTLPNE